MSNIRIAHLRRDPKNQYTIAYSFREIDNIPVVSIGWAKCNHKDQFNKKMGNAIATGRLRKNPVNIDIEHIGSDRYKAVYHWITSHFQSIKNGN